MTPLRVATYNVRDLRDDAAAAARVVRAVAPDVLCVQEAPRWLWSGPALRRFARECGMRWTGQHLLSGGTTVLTADRAAVSLRRTRHLWVRPFRSPRGYAVVRVGAPGLPPVVVASVHLGLFAPERLRHARAIVRRLAGPGPLVLAGDLNETGEGGALDLLRRDLDLVSADRPTYPSFAPRHRLDVVLASRDLRAVDGPPVELPPEVYGAASDHRPAWADLLPAEA